MESMSPEHAVIPAPQFVGGWGGQTNGQDSPAAQSTITQVMGPSQPIASTGPAQLDNTVPQLGCSTCGQKKGQESPSPMQISGIGHPMGSVSPGQLLIPSPQSTGGKGGQGAGTARAVERRLKSRRDISRLTLIGNSVFPDPLARVYTPIPHVTCLLPFL